MNSSFDDLKSLVLDLCETYSSSGPTGIFDVSIKTKAKKTYFFSGLKRTYTLNPDIVGFSLNHSFWNCRTQSTKKSKFHDSEDVSVDISRSDFISFEFFERPEEDEDFENSPWELKILCKSMTIEVSANLS